ncbi:hypothetical protein [Sphingomonas sp. CFBP 13706]|uniref:hypothetical protein n=1 Tax=Sphingomonas sp. CFBP 13706 TaxID=2775314 RepID=UPI0017823BCD|nr:hypothetical protein [Sphingomonas sp. CFBP 13706]MBD8734879.1 hypothetical protein [Sphingomonas sp. CFBP 13706]
MAPNSPYPDSFLGNGFLFGGALFALVLMTCFAILIFTVFAKQLWYDRHQGINPASIFCSVFLTISCAMIIRCAPEAVWMISYAELDRYQRATVGNVKRFLDLFALFPVGLWMSLILMWKDEILLKLKAPTARIWVDYRITPLKRVLPLAALCMAFALFVTLGRAYS